MSAPQFTPGPWRYEHRAKGHPAFNILVARRAVIVAKAWVVEDARLIAAAPELYEWLEAALDEREQEHGSLPDSAPHWSVRARHALARVRGGQ